MALPTPIHPVYTRAQALLSTQGRRRMAVVAGAALFFGLFTVGSDVVLPLWVMGDLHFSNSAWAQLRMVRMLGILGGIIILGPLSDRFGQRLMAAGSMVAVAAILVALAFGPAQTIWYVMPVFGALVSTAFVNLNTLTQGVSARRQGLANTIYRCVGAVAGVAAPFLVTWLALLHGDYRPVFLECAVVLLVAAAILWRYPGEQLPTPLADARAELRRMLGGYRTALRERPLMGFINVSLLLGSALAALGTFAPAFFTRAWGQSDQWFGALGSITGGIVFAGMVGIGVLLDRLSLRTLHLVCGLLASVAMMVVGLSHALPVTVAAFIAAGLLGALLIAPTSMWVSRAAGAGTQTAAFTVHKVLTAVYFAAAMWLFGLLEQHLGIRLLLIISGAAGILASLAFLLLREPPRLRG